MTTTAITRLVVLERTFCVNCDITFAVPADWLNQRRRDGRTFYCPNGHNLSYTESDADRLRKRVAHLEVQKTHLADQRDAERRARQAAEKSAAAQRGENTKLRKRAANGVCPCCHRSFTQLRRHMTAKHPGYVQEANGHA
jgi:hypothetical protein